MTPTPAQPDAGTLFAIGTVARMTGLGKDTIRAWERRYGAVEPYRTPTGGRLYTREDIARLALLKRLVDSGERAGLLCKLSREELDTRVELHARHEAQAQQRRTSTPPRVAVIGGALTARLAHDESSLPGVDVVVLYEDARKVAGALSAPVDVLVVEIPAINVQTADEVKRLMSTVAAAHALIVYGFGTRHAVEALHTSTATPVRAPVGLTELRKLILASTPRVETAPTSPGQHQPEACAAQATIPSRRFDDAALAALAAAATPLECECPHHLVDLIRSLLAFERYSGDCESRNEQDAAVHRLVHQVTAQARASLETGLAEVARHEGLLPAKRQQTTQA